MIFFIFGLVEIVWLMLFGLVVVGCCLVDFVSLFDDAKMRREIAVIESNWL